MGSIEALIAVAVASGAINGGAPHSVPIRKEPRGGSHPSRAGRGFG